MANLYELTNEFTSPELTDSLAQSFKNKLFIPTEKKFNNLENEIKSLKEDIEADTQKISLSVHDRFTIIETELEILKKIYRISASLSITTLVGIITTLYILLTW